MLLAFICKTLRFHALSNSEIVKLHFKLKKISCTFSLYLMVFPQRLSVRHSEQGNPHLWNKENRSSSSGYTLQHVYP